MLAWLNGSDEQPPALLGIRSSKVFIVGSIAAAVFTDLFLYGIIVPVLPFALTSRADIPEDKVQYWTSILLAVYGAALFVGSPLAGFFADRSEHRRGPLLLGLVALAGATAILTAGNSVGVLVAGRILQGLSAAVVWVVGLALIADTVGADNVGAALGYVGLAMNFGVLLSPLIGGVVFARLGYYEVFAISFALLGMDIVLRLALIERKVARRWIKEDDVLPEGNTTELVSPIADTNKQAPSGDSLPAAGETPATTEKPSRLPKMLILLGSRRLLCSCLGALVQAILLTSFDSTLPLFVKDTFGWNSLGAGLMFLPVTLPSLLAPLIGGLSDRFGPRFLATAGYLLAAPAIILMRLVTQNTIQHKVLLCALLAILGLSLALQLTPVMAEITYAVEDTVRKRARGNFADKGVYAQAYGLFNMAFAAGSMLGPLVGGLITQSAGWAVSTLVLGVLSATWAVPTLYWCGGSWLRMRRRKAEQQTGSQVDNEPSV